MKIKSDQEAFIRLHHTLLTVGEFAKEFKLSRATIYGFMKRKKLSIKKERVFGNAGRPRTAEETDPGVEYFNPRERGNWLI